MANIEISIRDDGDSSIELDCDIAGYFMRISGNGIEMSIELDDRHLQEIVDKLGDWGWKTAATEEESANG